VPYLALAAKASEYRKAKLKMLKNILNTKENLFSILLLRRAGWPFVGGHLPFL
jgi:hypothetical protein